MNGARTPWKGLSGISRSSSSSSTNGVNRSVHGKESRDDIESYLSIFKKTQEYKERGERSAVDWGKLLDRQGVQEEMQTQVNEENEEEDDYSDESVAKFLKPRAKHSHVHPKPTQHTQSSNHLDTQHTERCDGRETKHSSHGNVAPGRHRNLPLAASKLDINPSEESITITSDTSSEVMSHNTGVQQLKGLVVENALDNDKQHLFNDSIIIADSDTAFGCRARSTDGVTTSHQHHRHDTRSSKTLSEFEQSESDLSLTGNFRNNLFTLDQLKASFSPSEQQETPSISLVTQHSHHTDTSTANDKRDNSVCGSEDRRPFKLHSITELELIIAARDDLSEHSKATKPKETDLKWSETDSEQSWTTKVAGDIERSLGSSKKDRSYGTNITAEETDEIETQESEILSYEDDFESPTVGSSESWEEEEEEEEEEDEKAEEEEKEEEEGEGEEEEDEEEATPKEKQENETSEEEEEEENDTKYMKEEEQRDMQYSIRTSEIGACKISHCSERCHKQQKSKQNKTKKLRQDSEILAGNEKLCTNVIIVLSALYVKYWVRALLQCISLELD